jgi:hypothetical protein
MRLNSWILLMATSSALAACGDDEPTPTPPPPGGAPRQCGGAGYVAFDTANHQAQDLRLGAFKQMAELMEEGFAAPFSAATAAMKFGEAEMLYQNTAELQTKVKGRKDDHFAEQPAIGMELDTRITAAFQQGKTATTALSAELAFERVEKTLLHFFFLSVYHEMVEGEAATWDEAFGYFGAPSDNAEGQRKGLAEVATKRDASNGTTLESQIFNAIIDGSCEIAKALEAGTAEPLDWKTIPALKSAVETADLKMQEVLVYSAAHEAAEMVEVQGELPAEDARHEIQVELVELDAFFHAVEPLMLAKGGASADRARRIRARIDAAFADRTGAWMATFEAAETVAELEAEYGIDVRE